MQKRTIDPAEWDAFLSEFSDRNAGRRARFEAFTEDGVAEEDEEGSFQSVSIDAHVITVDRVTANGEPIEDTVEDVRGIAVQLDSDESENTLELADSNGDVTVLHFESMVDGES
ncbi:MAG: hypothetical protein AB7F88_16120 [Pyrinomonadaceae bacterium]